MRLTGCCILHHFRYELSCTATAAICRPSDELDCYGVRKVKFVLHDAFFAPVVFEPLHFQVCYLTILSVAKVMYRRR